MSDADAIRTYDKPGIRVHWQAGLCQHSGNCVRGLPTVFDPKRRPWIDVEGATADEIAATIDTCPSRALRYDRVD